MEDFVLSSEAQREQTALQTSIEHMRAERLEIDAQNCSLQALIEREERLAAHLREVLAASRSERQEIEEEQAFLSQLEAEDDGTLQIQTRPPFNKDGLTITHTVPVMKEQT